MCNGSQIQSTPQPPYTGGPTPPELDDSYAEPERQKINLEEEGYDVGARLPSSELVARWLQLGPGHYRQSLPLVRGMLYESPVSDHGRSRSSSSSGSFMAWSEQHCIPGPEQRPDVETMSL